jgi:hypothetical protein
MTANLQCTTEITVEVPPEQAMTLFTPEGERQWADGWNPRYPEPGRREGPGAVFTTSHGGRQTAWIMVDHKPDAIRYARVAPGMTAGTVTVQVIDPRNDITHLRVSYDLTALSAAGQKWLETFAAHGEAELAAWSTEIAEALQARSAACDA